MSSKLKKRYGETGQRITYKDTTQIIQNDYPIFCLRHLHKNYSVMGLDVNEANQLIHQLYKLSQLTWGVINTTGRHGMGYEKIPIQQIKSNINTSFTEDVKKIMVFRFDGLKPFLGHRKDNTLHLLFIDPKMELYDH